MRLKLKQLLVEDRMSDENDTYVAISVSGKTIAEVAAKVDALYAELHALGPQPSTLPEAASVVEKPKASRGRPKKTAEPAAEQPADIFTQQLNPPAGDPFGLNTTGTNGGSGNSAPVSTASVSPEDLKKKLAEVDRLLGTEKALQLLKDAGCAKLSDLNKASSEVQQQFITACDAAVAFAG